MQFSFTTFPVKMQCRAVRRPPGIDLFKSMAKQDNYKKERTETALSFHFSDFGMRGYISMVKPSGLFLRFSFSFW